MLKSILNDKNPLLEASKLREIIADNDCKLFKHLEGKELNNKLSDLSLETLGYFKDLLLMSLDSYIDSNLAISHHSSFATMLEVFCEILDDESIIPKTDAP